jgi:crotonobetainyl-CoA:carnitine CoA-transferase CaiB-like acyl-CoA transferase
LAKKLEDGMAGPLTGIRVVELAVMLNGPGCGYMLGDLGAEIIKIEDPVQGDISRGVQSLWGLPVEYQGVNTFFETPNRNKKSIGLDLKKEKGQEVLRRLIKKSDVFITNFSKRVCKKLGCDYETLCKYNPKIIYGGTSGFGSRGPETGLRVFDITAQARSGFMTQVGDKDSPPSIVVGGVIDQLGATMLAYGILAALVARERMGIGQELETSLLGSAIHQQAISVNQVTLQGRSMARHSRLRARNPLSNHYECADEKWIMLAEIQSDKYWHDFCEALGIQEVENDPRFASASARRENFADCINIIDKVFKTKPRDEWINLLREKCKGMACAEVFELSELLNQPQVLENEYIIENDHPILGPVKLVGYPVQFSKTPAKMNRGAPQFKEHTEEILLNICEYSWEEIEELNREEVV